MKSPAHYFCLSYTLWLTLPPPNCSFWNTFWSCTWFIRVKMWLLRSPLWLRPGIQLQRKQGGWLEMSMCSSFAHKNELCQCHPELSPVNFCLWIMNWKEPLIASESTSSMLRFFFPSSAVLRSEVPVNLLNLLPSCRANCFWPWSQHVLLLLTIHPSRGRPAGKRHLLISQWGPNIPVSPFLLRSSRLLLYLWMFWLRYSENLLYANIKHIFYH